MSIASEMDGKKHRKGRATHERQKISRDEFMRAIFSDVDPLKHAGEGWFNTEEYARPADIHDPYVRGDVGHEGEYYPPPDRKNKMKKY